MTEDAWKIEAMKAKIKSKSTVSSMLHKLMLDEYKDNSTLRDTKHFHPSEICKRDWCVRQSVYKIMGMEESNPERPKAFTTLNVFEEGNLIHRKWQNWLNKAGVLRGQWFCLECEHQWYGENQCTECKSLQVSYREVPIYDDEHHILGHSDGHVVSGDDEYLIEIKSLGMGTFRYENFPLFNKYATKEITADQMWNELTRPFLSHLRQGNLYMHCTGIHKMIFIYEWKASQAVKEFNVAYQPEVINDILFQLRGAIYDLEANMLPERPEWIDSKDHQACKYCTYKKICWSSDDESTSKVQSEIRYPKETGGSDAGSAGADRRIIRR